MRDARKIAVIDCETDPFKLGRVPKPFIWGYYNGKEYHEFTEEKELVSFLSNRREIIYAHNGGKFDYFYILDYLEPFSDITIINGRLAKFSIGDAEFRDSYNILPLPLSAMQKSEIDYEKMEENARHLHMPEIKAYLKDDCVFLYNFVNDFIKNYGVNLTLAGTALKQWRKIGDIGIPDSTQGFYDDFSKYYYGGRVECFKKGVFEGHFQSYDINSAYPFAMLDVHPYSTSYKEKKFEGEFINQNFYTIIADSHGALPQRTDNGLNFPRVENELFYSTGWEINTGIKTNTVEVKEVKQEFEFQTLTCFSDYVNHFYEMKKNAANKSEYIFAKLFMNSLYGKFAANPEKYKETMILDKKYIEAGIEDGYEFAGELGQWALMRQDLAEEKQKYYNVATAASITGFVRAYLWEHICKLKEENKNVLYCDTDCIFFEGRTEPKFSIGSELGEWEKEGDYTRGAVAGKKLYSFEPEKGKAKIASKGCRLNSKQIFEIAKGKEILYEDIAPIYSVYKEPKFLQRKIKST